MKNAPFFSVIIPTFNREHSIIEAIDSVITQTFEDFEVIIIDDGSTDATSNLVTQLAEKEGRLIYVFQENQERSASRNNGIAFAKGEYICFLDSDDLFLPFHLEQLKKAILVNKSPKAMIVVNPVYPKGAGFEKVPAFVPDTADPMELVIKTAICSQQTCIHHEILAKHKFNVNLRIGEDQELWTRIIGDYPLIRTEQFSVVIRDFGDRTIDSTNVDSYLENIRLKKLLFSNDQNHRIKPEWRRFVLSASYFKLAMVYLNRKEKSKFYFNILQSFLISPSHYWKDKMWAIASTLPFFSKQSRTKVNGKG
jgi:glycosyltransferase involved in cell wall biosynthesis